MVREFRALRAGGVREVSLIAQDLGDFGKDFGVPSQPPPSGTDGGPEADTVAAAGPREGTPQLIDLLAKLLASEAPVYEEGRKNLGGKATAAVLPSFWLRLLYLYPDEITPPLLALMASSQGRLAPYIDMPIQVRRGHPRPFFPPPAFARCASLVSAHAWETYPFFSTSTS